MLLSGLLSPDRVPEAFKKASGRNVTFTIVTIPMQDKRRFCTTLSEGRSLPTCFFFYFSRLDGIMYFSLKVARNSFQHFPRRSV